MNKSRTSKSQASDHLSTKSARALPPTSIQLKSHTTPQKPQPAHLLLLFCSIAVGVRRGLLKVGRSESEWRDEGGAEWLERCEGLGESCDCSNTEVCDCLLLLRYATVCFCSRACHGVSHGEGWDGNCRIIRMMVMCGQCAQVSE
jgi:hypothetical protein